LAMHLAAPLNAGRGWFFTKTASRLYTEARFQRGDVLVFGCETRGLPMSLMGQNTERTLKIPIRQQVRSLNLSVAAGVAMYEAVRQMEAQKK
jgi:tRNA (cytidine/uridine-2'-O-)-methyltransferase